MKRFRRLWGMGVEKKDIGHLPLPARIYILAVTFGALAVAGYSAGQWHTADMGQFLLCLAGGILCSNLKVHLPGITGTMSVNYLFILAAITDLSLAQTVATGCTSGAAQLVLRARKRPQVVQVLFAFGSQTICSAVAYAIYHAGWMPDAVPFRLLGASTAYFFSNTVSVGAIICLSEGKQFWPLWRDNFFWTAPHYLAGGALAGLLHYWNQYAGWETAVLVFPIVYLVYRSYRLYLGRLEEEKRHVAEVADLQLRTIQTLTLAIDARDGTTYGHLRRVQVYARELARELGLPEDERRALDAAALLHDIGKLAVPEHIISKPGRLTPEEFEKMKVHPVVGAEILENVQFPYPVVPIVRAHHEKWDGTGYPDGLKGEEIPMGARIVAAVDCLDALASDRQYRRALPLDEAMRWVAEQSGKSFDPRVVDLLQRRYQEFEELARKQGQATFRLSTAIKIGNGGGPAAGFEPSSTAPPSTKPTFIDSIAAARQEFQALLELTHELGSSLRVDEILALLASRLKALIPHHCIAIYTAEGSGLACRYASGEDAALFSSLAIPLGEGISGWVVRNNKPIVNGNPSMEHVYLNDSAKCSVHRSALSVPLPGAQGVVGALTLYHREGGAFTRDHMRVLMAVSSIAGLTIENALRFVQVEETAATDSLTGLPNARMLFQRLDTGLQDAAQRGGRLAILVTDMDGFKKVNDQFGHATGDLVLREAAEVLKQACRGGDCVARMGGDEFVLLLADAEPEAVGVRIRTLDVLVAQAGERVCGVDFLRLSAGAAFFPEDGRDAEELLAMADARMYEMKRRHHGQATGAAGLQRLADAVAAPGELQEHLPLGSAREEC
jgi:diguanylate cyclase (GGDEF)-like protein/putative nucleotidyltransferase with HDIG domain